MSAVAATTLAALLIASPSNSDVARIAANGGFLIGNAQRCGVPGERVVRAGQLVQDLIAASANNSKEQDEATARFAAFFLVSAFPDQGKEKTVASCKLVSAELAKLEQHLPPTSAEPAVGTTGDGLRPGDGE